MPSKSRGSARDLAIARSKDHRAIGVGVHIEGALQRHTCQAIRAAPQQRRDMRQFRTIGAGRGKGIQRPVCPLGRANHARRPRRPRNDGEVDVLNTRWRQRACGPDEFKRGRGQGFSLRSQLKLH